MFHTVHPCSQAFDSIPGHTSTFLDSRSLPPLATATVSHQDLLSQHLSTRPQEHQPGPSSLLQLSPIGVCPATIVLACLVSFSQVEVSLKTGISRMGILPSSVEHTQGFRDAG